MPEKRVEVKFADENVRHSFKKLKIWKGEEQEIFKLISNAIEKLKKDPFWGIRIPKRLIPKFYIQNYQVSNLRKINLTSSWRLTYTLVGDENTTTSIILEWLNHKGYERRFGY